MSKEKDYSIRTFLNIQTSNTELIPVIVEALTKFTHELAEYNIIAYTNIQSGAPTNPPTNPPKP